MTAENSIAFGVKREPGEMLKTLPICTFSVSVSLRGRESLSTTSLDLGEPLDLKFKYGLSNELDARETVHAILFRSAREFTRRT